VILPVVVGSLLMTGMQRLVLGGLDFTVIRIVLAATVLRIVLRMEYKSFKLNEIDRALILYVVFSVVVYAVRVGTMKSLTYRLGFGYTMLGEYFVARFLIRRDEDFVRVIKCFGLLLAIIACFMVVERITGRNLFAVFGGVPEFTLVRAGSLRSQGPFPHPLLAGAVGAASFPLFVRLFLKDNDNIFIGFVGIVGSTLMVVTSASSGPVIGYAAALIGLAAWPMRQSLRLLWFGFIIGLLLLDLVMKAPVWALLARIDIVGGSTGYHRFILVDQAIRRVKDWILVGADTAAWGEGLWDVTNQYITVGTEGGGSALVFFVLMLIRCFSVVGKYIRTTPDQRLKRSAWIYGTSLWSHVCMFWGMAYFGDQVLMVFLVLIAAFSTLVRDVDSEVINDHDGRFVRETAR